MNIIPSGTPPSLAPSTRRDAHASRTWSPLGTDNPGRPRRRRAGVCRGVPPGGGWHAEQDLHPTGSAPLGGHTTECGGRHWSRPSRRPARGRPRDADPVRRHRRESRDQRHGSTRTERVQHRPRVALATRALPPADRPGRTLLVASAVGDTSPTSPRARPATIRSAGRALTFVLKYKFDFRL